MATNLSDALDVLIGKAASLRQAGITAISHDGLSATLLPWVPPPAEEARETSKDPPDVARRRAHYEGLFNRRVGDDELGKLP